MIGKSIKTVSAAAYEKIYFSDSSSNGLYRYCIKNDSVDFVDFFPGQDMRTQYLHHDACECDGCVFFLGSNGYTIDGYNCIDGKFISIQCHEQIVRLSECNDLLYGISSSGNIWDLISGVIRMNIGKDDNSHMNITYDKTRKIKDGFVICDDAKKTVVNICLKTFSCDVIKLPVEDVEFVSLINNEYWIVHDSSFNISIYNESDRTIKTIKVDDNKWIGKDNHRIPYTDLVPGNDFIIAANYYSQYPVLIDRYNYHAMLLKTDNVHVGTRNSGNGYGGLFGTAIYESNTYLLMPYLSTDFVKFDELKRELTCVEAVGKVEEDYLYDMKYFFEGEVFVDQDEFDETEWPLKYLVKR